MVRDAEVWRMNSVTAPSRARASRTNLAISSVRSTKPAPFVCTSSCEETMVAALTVDGAERVSDFMERPCRVGKGVFAVPTNSCDEYFGGHASLCPPYEFVRRDDACKSAGLDLARYVLLHAVGHLDQPPPGLFQKSHHAVHVAVARQRNFDLALALGDLRLRLLQLIRFRQRFVDLAGDRRIALGQLGLQFFIIGLQPADLCVERPALVRHGVAGPTGAGTVAGGNRTGPGVEPQHAVGDR